MASWRIGDSWNSTASSVKPAEEVHVKKPSKQKLIAIFGGAGVALLVVIIIVIAFFCLKRLRRVKNRTFNAQSSFESTSAQWHKAASSNAVVLSTLDANNLLQLRFLDLEHATGKFCESNIIGEGAFGMVYKGLLADGTIVSIKRRLQNPIKSLPHIMNYTTHIKHKHLVKLVGFCQENHQQLLVYEYLLNRDVGNHLYDNEGMPTGKLDMDQRLQIAIGAAKGLAHLHSFQPPILHMHFRTRNVLVDETFTAKVSDFGIFGLLVDGCYVLPPSAIDCFLDPQLKSYKNFSKRSDVYSFGVFLLELISGHKAFAKNQNDEQKSLVSQAKNMRHLEEFVDKKLRNYNSTQAMKQLLELALLCADNSMIRRPSMKNVVRELEVIQRTIIGCYSNEETANVTLGSLLFGSQIK